MINKDLIIVVGGMILGI